MQLRTNCSIDHRIKAKAEEHKLSPSDCLTFGIMFKVAEIEGENHPNNTLSKKLANMSRLLGRTLEELEDAKKFCRGEFNQSREGDNRT